MSLLELLHAEKGCCSLNVMERGVGPLEAGINIVPLAQQDVFSLFWGQLLDGVSDEVV